MIDFTSDDIGIIREKGNELAGIYPIEANYGSRASLWSCGLNDNLVSPDLYKKAKTYYGSLWTYVGD